MIKVGSKVTIPWWETDMFGKSTRVTDLKGVVESINGAYHLVNIIGNPKYDVIELYPVEMIEV